MENIAFARARLDIFDAASETVCDAVATSNGAEAHAVVYQAGALGIQILLEQHHKVIDFASWTPPIVGGKCVERERGDSERWCGLERASHRRRSGDMARLSR